MFRFFSISILLYFFGGSHMASAQNDTTIYQITEKRASFPGCDWSWYSEQEKDSCRQYNLMDFLRSNLRYPTVARDSNISGKVVVRFVVEKDGSLSNIRTLKDIGGGCGDEAKRILAAMNEIKLRWLPGELGGKVVRSYFTLPVSFKLQEDPGYTIVDGYPVFYLYDKPLAYKGGDDALNQFIIQNTKIPKILNDSCKAGVIQAEVLVLPNGIVKPLQIDDFANLGFDAQFEAIQAITKTAGRWEYAEYKGKQVPTSMNIRVAMKPDAAQCKNTLNNFEVAYAKINEAISQSDKKEYDNSLKNFDEAIRLLPYNMETYYLRGLIYMNMQRNDDACKDLSRVKQNLNVNWVDNILPLICK
jgi:hypothetical protein